ncbi:hypothetical protein D5086_011727 [Populus alba]|uniref:Uncharacterized protein n=1 Tax=Populus alba TaxID=43335 RepID=A0ACC4CD58_POPAL
MVSSLVDKFFTDAHVPVLYSGPHISSLSKVQDYCNCSRKRAKNEEVSVPGVEFEFAYRCCLYDAFVHFQAREMGNKSKKNYLARRDVFNWTEPYDNMVRELRENIGMPFEKDHLRNRLKTLKNNFKECFDIFNGANERTKSNGASTTKEKADQWLGSGSPYLLDGFNLPNEVTFNLEDSNEMNDGTVKLATPVEANSQADSQGFERELKGIKDAIKEVARAIREGNLIAERGRPRVYSEQEVFPELVRIGVETHLRYKASTFLVANSGRMKAFFGCPPWERRDSQIYKNPSFLIGLAKEIKRLSPDQDVSVVLDNCSRYLHKGSLSLTIRELGHLGLPERALQTFCWVQKQPRLFPDDRVLASTVEVLARNHDLKVPFNLEKFTNLASRRVIEAMVKGLIRGGSLKLAWKLISVAKDGKRMLDPSVYAKIILELGKNPDKHVLAEALLDELAEREDLNLSQQDCTAVMKVCIKLGKFEAVESLNLITLYMVSGRLAKCKEVWKEAEMAGFKFSKEMTAGLLQLKRETRLVETNTEETQTLPF